MVYTVKYRKQNQWFFRTVTNVKGDFVASDVPGAPRVLVLNDETRVEIASVGTDFVFSKDRWMVIKQRMDEEAGQPIQVKKD